MPTAHALSLVADIGGTNTRVALAQGKKVQQASIRRFHNADYPGLEPILRQYLAEAGAPACVGACVAAAGPVHDGVATMTNLDWIIDDALLTRATSAATVAILNDLQAQGHALGHIAADNLLPVLPGHPAPAHAAKLVVGVGTGFNAAPVHETKWGRLVAASECGHVNMPIRHDADLALAHFVEAEHGFAGAEEVMSGRGLEALYAFVTADSGLPGARTAAEIMGAIAEDGPETAAARLFVRMLGMQVGNLALIHLPFGGIYLCGGVSRAIAPHLTAMGFAEAFHDKGRFAGFMQNFPVSVITDDYAALTGCAVFLAQA
ncbi:glucokinase [Rhodobacter ferrooxidans]|uniref:Glucokinase n=1 Tax=Rhodobacter ferrooxidans TaxID=371731 RepID=C8S0J2_9RHOB|nr:glucokinase [Rhodobacter sp. SW2]EEW25526.1 Glucokinase [Rhodobacter sp. SW2]